MDPLQEVVVQGIPRCQLGLQVVYPAIIVHRFLEPCSKQLWLCSIPATLLLFESLTEPTSDPLEAFRHELIQWDVCYEVDPAHAQTEPFELAIVVACALMYRIGP